MARCLYRSVSKCFFLCFLFWTTMILKSVSTAENECTYKGDICKIDYQKCLAEKYFSDMEECDSWSMHYGPGPIYDTRKEIRFYITIDRDREYYAENLTYRILHARLNKMEKNFTSIDDCCSVGEKETCILPPLNNQVTERQYAFVPLSEAPDKYCYFPIYEHPGHVPWCHEKPEPDSVCKIFKDGKLIIRNNFEAPSTKNFVDYCFFEAPGEYIKANRTNTAKNNKYTLDVVGISYGEKDGEIRIGNETRSCEITKEIEKHVERHKRSANKGACFFTRTKLDNKWDASPICTIPLLKDPDPPEETTKWFTIGYVVASSLIVIFFALLSLWFYKRYIKASFIKYPEAIKELRNIDVLEDSERQNFIENNASKQLNLESVHPDLIVPIDFTHGRRHYPNKYASAAAGSIGMDGVSVISTENQPFSELLKLRWYRNQRKNQYQMMTLNQDEKFQANVC